MPSLAAARVLGSLLPHRTINLRHPLQGSRTHRSRTHPPTPFNLCRPLQRRGPAPPPPIRLSPNLHPTSNLPPGSILHPAGHGFVSGFSVARSANKT